MTPDLNDRFGLTGPKNLAGHDQLKFHSIVKEQRPHDGYGDGAARFQERFRHET